MDPELQLLSLISPTGNGQPNRPDDVEALDGALRQIDAYQPPAEYSGSPQRYTTEPMIRALERFQEQNGLKIDGYANPGGPTERAINNRILRKPRGAGLLVELPAPIRGSVGNGLQNDEADVANVKRQLGALGYLPEDPFDRPSGFIDERTTNAIRQFQAHKGLKLDGGLAPGGETEAALNGAVVSFVRTNGDPWSSVAKAMVPPELPDEKLHDETSSDSAKDERNSDVTLVRGPPVRPGIPPYYPPFSPNPGPRLPPTTTPQYPRRGPSDFRDHTPILPRIEAFPPSLPNPRDSGSRLPTLNEIRRALGLPPVPSTDEELARELTIPQRAPSTDPNIYVPSPGSPLHIPILDVYRPGRLGDPKTTQSTRDLADAIEKACKDVFKERVTFERKLERYFPPYGKPDTRRDASYADGWIKMKIKMESGVFAVEFLNDTYTPKVNLDPILAEERRYAKLQLNTQDLNKVTVRMPKPWKFGEEINTEKLAQFSKELCEQIKNMLDRSEIGPSKKKLQLEKLFKELTKPKPKDPPLEPPAKPN